MEQVKLAKAAKAAKADAKGKAKAEAQGMRKGRPSKASKGAPVEPEAVDKASVASLAAACESGLVVLVPPGWQDAAVGLVGANAVCAERTDELKRRLLSVVGRRRAEGTMQPELPKVFGAAANTFFFQIKHLEARHLLISEPDVDYRDERGRVAPTVRWRLPRFAPPEIRDRPPPETRIAKSLRAICEVLAPMPKRTALQKDLSNLPSISIEGHDGPKKFRALIKRLVDAGIVKSYRARKEGGYDEADAKGAKGEGPAAGDIVVQLLSWPLDRTKLLAAAGGFASSHDEDGAGGAGTNVLLPTRPKGPMQASMPMQLYKAIEKAGSNGVKQTDLLRDLGLQEKRSANALQVLKQHKLVESDLQRQGRQQVHYWYKVGVRQAGGGAAPIVKAEGRLAQNEFDRHRDVRSFKREAEITRILEALPEGRRFKNISAWRLELLETNPGGLFAGAESSFEMKTMQRLVSIMEKKGAVVTRNIEHHEAGKMAKAHLYVILKSDAEKADGDAQAQDALQRALSADLSGLLGRKLERKKQKLKAARDNAIVIEEAPARPEGYEAKPRNMPNKIPRQHMQRAKYLHLALVAHHAAKAGNKAAVSTDVLGTLREMPLNLYLFVVGSNAPLPQLASSPEARKMKLRDLPEDVQEALGVVMRKPIDGKGKDLKARVLDNLAVMRLLDVLRGLGLLVAGEIRDGEGRLAGSAEHLAETSTVPTLSLKAASASASGSDAVQGAAGEGGAAGSISYDVRDAAGAEAYWKALKARSEVAKARLSKARLPGAKGPRLLDRSALERLPAIFTRVPRLTETNAWGVEVDIDLRDDVHAALRADEPAVDIAKRLCLAPKVVHDLARELQLPGSTGAVSGAARAKRAAPGAKGSGAMRKPKGRPTKLKAKSAAHSDTETETETETESDFESESETESETESEGSDESSSSEEEVEVARVPALQPRGKGSRAPWSFIEDERLLAALACAVAARRDEGICNGDLDEDSLDYGPWEWDATNCLKIKSGFSKKSLNWSKVYGLPGAATRCKTRLKSAVKALDDSMSTALREMIDAHVRARRGLRTAAKEPRPDTLNALARYDEGVQTLAEREARLLVHKFVKAWRQKRGRKCDLDDDDTILPASKRAKQAARPSRKRPRADDDGSPIAATAAEVAAVARAFAADIEYGADPDDGSDVTAKRAAAAGRASRARPVLLRTPTPAPPRRAPRELDQPGKRFIACQPPLLSLASRILSALDARVGKLHQAVPLAELLESMGLVEDDEVACALAVLVYERLIIVFNDDTVELARRFVEEANPDRFGQAFLDAQGEAAQGTAFDSVSVGESMALYASMALCEGRAAAVVQRPPGENDKSPVSLQEALDSIKDIGPPNQAVGATVTFSAPPAPPTPAATEGTDDGASLAAHWEGRQPQGRPWLSASGEVRVARAAALAHRLGSLAMMTPGINVQQIAHNMSVLGSWDALQELLEASVESGVLRLVLEPQAAAPSMLQAPGQVTAPVVYYFAAEHALDPANDRRIAEALARKAREALAAKAVQEVPAAAIAAATSGAANALGAS